MAGRAAQMAGFDQRAFADAHRALLADRSIQFDLPAVVRHPPPHWLVAFGHWLGQLLRPFGKAVAWLFGLLPDAPYARILLWTVLALAGCALLWAIALRLRGQAWRWPWRRRPADAVAADDDAGWQPEPGPVRRLLDEADALAAEGRYGEAAHLLLWRSIEDIERRRPRLVRPALTSRDIAAADGLPEAARTTFAGIARAVERSLFGGRALGAADWGACRAAYAEFALPKAWR